MPEEYGGAGLGVQAAGALLRRGRAQRRRHERRLDAAHLDLRHGAGDPPRLRGAQARSTCRPTATGELHVCVRRHRGRRRHRHLAHPHLRARATATAGSSNGKKIWNTKAQQAQKILLLARTTPREECAKPLEGMTLFLADLDPALLRDPRDRQARPRGGQLERGLHPRPARRRRRRGGRGGARLLLPARRAQPRAHHDRGRGGGHRPRRRSTRRCTTRASAWSSTGRSAEPGDRPPAGGFVLRARGRRAAVAEGGVDVRQRGAVRPARQHGEAARERGAAFGPATARCRPSAAWATRKECNVERYLRESRLHRIAPISQRDGAQLHRRARARSAALVLIGCNPVLRSQAS